GSAFVGWSRSCDGSEPICSVDLYSSHAVTAWFNPAPPDQPLANQAPLAGSIEGPVTGGTWSYYSVDLGSGNGELVADLVGLSGDAGLYVRFGSKPTHAARDCRDKSAPAGIANRRCVLTAPAAGRWWIGVNNQEAGVSIHYTLRASWGTPVERELANRSAWSDAISSTQPGEGWKYYFVDLPAGSTDLTGELPDLPAGATLYLRHGAKPDRSNHDCPSIAEDRAVARCAIAAPAAGRWWIAVNSLAAGAVPYSVKASWKTVDTPTDFFVLSPCRALDTRTTAQPLAAGVARTIQIAGRCGVPATARAVAVNVTVVSPTAAGYLVLYPGDEGVPASAVLNFGSGQLRSNNAILKLSTDGAGTLGALAGFAATGQVHLIVDVSGYFQ